MGAPKKKKTLTLQLRSGAKVVYSRKPMTRIKDWQKERAAILQKESETKDKTSSDQKKTS